MIEQSGDWQQGAFAGCFRGYKIVPAYYQGQSLTRDRHIHPDDAVIVYCYWLANLRVRAVAATYTAHPNAAVADVGWFSLGISRWLLNRGLVRVSANDGGLELWFAIPPYYRPIFVPWEAIWIRQTDSALAPVYEIGFLGCPNHSYFFRATLINRLRSAVRGKIPNDCFV